MSRGNRGNADAGPTRGQGPLYPKLKARPGARREEVRANQRARLHGAMVEAVAEHGYAAVTVRRLSAIAGVSQKTIYDLFPNKEEYFLATYDRVVEEGMSRISAAYRAGQGDERDWNAGLCRAFEVFAAEIIERPKPSRLALLEILAAGPNGHERAELAERVFAQMLAQSFAQAPDEVAMPLLLLRSLVGGVWFVTRSRLLQGRPSTVLESGQELFRWMLAYRHPAVEKLTRQVPAPVPTRPALPRRPVDERTAMLRAVAELAATGGLPGLVPGQIAQRAGLEASAFSRHFEDVADCFFSSLELMGTESLARAMRTGEGAADWPATVCRSIQAMLCHIAEDPVFARAAFVAVYSIGPSGTPRRAELMRAFAAILIRQAPEGAKPSAVVAEAIVGSVWSIAHCHVLHHRARVLPSLAGYASYLALAPIVGAERALDAIAAELAPAAPVVGHGRS
ncbi:MAG: TetR/AcrR family transcriptional regulator [Actinobacteria bacterium]|nr:TetR/AcrR family transcriptional regulator [Actinomycetota bacterium]